jgi:spore coat protein YsxE
LNVSPWMQGREWWEVVRQYGWEPAKVEQVGGVWRVTCDDGAYALKLSPASREKLSLLARMIDSLHAEGFEQVLPWVRTTSGDAVVSGESGTWYATPWKERSEDEPEGKGIPASEVVQSLARLHRLSEPLVAMFPELCRPVARELADNWKKNKEELNDFAETTEQKKFPSPFENLYRLCQEQVERMFNFSIRGLERFAEAEEGKPPRFALCHRRIHPSNLVQIGERFYWIDFDHAQADSPARDLALAIRRFSGEEGRGETAAELLEAYEQENKLTPMERKLLALYLSYPEGVIRHVKGYVNRTRISSTEAEAVRELERELNRLEQLQELVRQLWPAKKAKTQPKSAPASVAAKVSKKRTAPPKRPT